MFSLMASLLFAAAFATAVTAMAVTFAAYKDKMFAALRMQPLHRQSVSWRTQPRRAARISWPGAVRQPRLNRAAA